MKMNTFRLVAAFVLLATALLAACGGGESQAQDLGISAEIAPLDDGVIRIVLLINGNLGDMSFFDSANAGMLMFQADHPEVEVKVVEMGIDTSVWEPTLRQTANEANDLIIVGTNDMAEPLQRLIRTGKYPDRRFIIFDTEIQENRAAEYPQVHSIMFRQNEGGYLAGLVAALMSIETGADRTGFIGGMRIDVINDFGYGFMQGVERVNNDYSTDIMAYNAYIGDFFNSPKGKSLADTMYTEGGVNILFAAASQAGLGALDSAKNLDKYIIGVDTDQYDYFIDTDPEKASHIVTSVLKRVDLALYNACQDFIDGDLTYADLVILGLSDEMVGIVDNSNYQAIVPEADRAYVQARIDDILSGQLIVASGLKRYTPITELNELFDKLDPNKR
jgi:basic membrane protein A and related proteins